MHQIPFEKPFLRFTEWARKYGGIYSLKIGPQNIVMISDVKILKELYEKRGSIYSSRPCTHIAGEILCPNQTHILFMPYGERARAWRRAYNAFMGPQKVGHLDDIQTAEAIRLLQKLVITPERYYEHICCNATAVILETHFGKFPKDYDDPAVKQLWSVQKRFVKLLALGSTPPVDAFPFLKYLPDVVSPWRVEAKNFEKVYHKLFVGLVDEVKARVARGEGTGSFLETLLQDKEKYGFEDKHVAGFSATLMEAGSDTTGSQILAFVLGCLHNTKVLPKAQEEVDRICGISRSPTLNDRDSMPFIKACVSEVLRWRPSLPFSAPRELEKDDYYEGYFLPKGTILFQLIWAMNMDPNIYDKPELFDPDRYMLNRFGTINDEALDAKNGRKETYAFGAGRKACAGESFARNTMFVVIAKLAWAFNITSPIDPQTGRAMPVDIDMRTAFTDGLSVTPSRFPVKFTIRSKEHQETIEMENLVAEDILFKQKGSLL